MRVVGIVIALVLAVLAGSMALKWNRAPVSPHPSSANTNVTDRDIQTVDVLVARAPIAMGTTLDESLVDRQPWPAHLALEGFVTGDIGTVKGMVARANFQAREPLMKTKLANPNEPGYLAAFLPKGMRASTVAVDAITGIAGYVFPGDRVDILLTHGIGGKTMSREREVAATQRTPKVAEVLIANARVIAVNQRSMTNGQKDLAGANVSMPSSGVTNVTLEVTPTNAQRLRLAEKLGALSLSLRSVHDGAEDAGLPSPTLQRDLSRAVLPVEAEDPEDEPSRPVKIIRGVEERIVNEMGMEEPAGGGGAMPPRGGRPNIIRNLGNLGAR